MQTVQDYITACRIQLQDTISGAYRYADSEFQLALDLALDEAYRIRPDLFIQQDAVSIVSLPLSYTPPVPRGYQSTFMYYMCGHVQLRDQEDEQDARAAVYLNKFIAQLMTTPA